MRGFFIWLGTEDYSAIHGSTPSGPASLRSTARNRSRRFRRTGVLILGPWPCSLGTKKPACAGFLYGWGPRIIPPSMAPPLRGQPLCVRLLGIAPGDSVEPGFSSSALGPVAWALKNPHARVFYMAGDRGFEPRHAESESGVLPLDESPKL